MRAWLRGPLLLALALVTQSARADDVKAAGEDTKKGAQTTFRAANDLFDAGRYQEALTAFRASYDIVRSPNSHLMIARSLRELGRLVEAHEELSATVEEARSAGERYERTAEVAEEELRELEARLGTVTFEVAGTDEPVTVRVGDRTFSGAELTASHKFEPGEIVATLETPSGETTEARAQVDAGKSVTLTLEVAPPAPEPPAAPAEDEPVEVSSSGIPLRTWSYVAGGVGVAGLATFAALGAVSSSKFDDLEKACPNRQCPPDQRTTIDDGEKFQLLANIGLGVGIAGIGAGVALFFLSDPPGAEEEQASSRRPRVSVGLGSIDVRGRF